MTFGKLGARGGFGSLGVLGRAGSSGPAPPSAPVLSENSESAGLVSLTWAIDNTVATGDSLHRQAQVSGGNWSSLVDDTTHVITSGEDLADQISNNQLTLPNGTYDIRGFIIRASDSAVSAASNTITLTISDALSGRLMWGTSQQLWSTDHLVWS